MSKNTEKRKNKSRKLFFEDEKLISCEKCGHNENEMAIWMGFRNMAILPNSLLKLFQRGPTQ